MRHVSALSLKPELDVIVLRRESVASLVPSGGCEFSGPLRVDPISGLGCGMAMM